jgi:hypothetical protein
MSTCHTQQAALACKGFKDRALAWFTKATLPQMQTYQDINLLLSKPIGTKAFQTWSNWP